MTSRTGHLEKHEEDNIEWRREKVQELWSKSLSVREIATILAIPKSTIHADIVHLRDQAQRSINKYIDETLVQEFNKIDFGLQLIVKNSWQRYEAAQTDKERFAFLSLVKDTYSLRASLLDSGTIIQKAIEFVNNNSIKARGLTDQNQQLATDTEAEQAQQHALQSNVPKTKSKKNNVSNQPK